MPTTPWYEDYVIELRGSESEDPTHTGTDTVDVTVALAGILPQRAIFGKVQQTGSKKLRGRNEAFIELACKPKPFTVLVGVRDDCQDYGYCWQLQKALGHTWVHVLALYRNSSDHAAGTIPRARWNGSGTDDDFFLHELTFPMTCVFQGEARPQPNFEQGWSTLDFTLTKSTPES
jgi:hypothetical protein